MLLSWIKETYQAEMIAFCANIGQEEELKGLDKKAKMTGASKHYTPPAQASGRGLGPAPTWATRRERARNGRQGAMNTQTMHQKKELEDSSR